jgi:hypothetical protein
MKVTEITSLSAGRMSHVGLSRQRRDSGTPAVRTAVSSSARSRAGRLFTVSTTTRTELPPERGGLHYAAWSSGLAVFS